MSSEWRAVRLGEICSINSDKRSKNWLHETMYYIDISSVGEGRFIQAIKEIQTSQAPSRAQRLLKGNDTIVSTVRPNRRSMIFLRDVRVNMVASTGFAVLRANLEILDSRFLYFLVYDHSFTAYLESKAEGSAYPAVNQSVFEQAIVKIPPLKEQRNISGFLGALDDRITLLRETNATLEAIAQALFKSWFVDFDLVRAKAEGLQPEGMDAETAALFPNCFEEFELGLVPKGWKVSQLSSLINIIGGGTPKTSNPEYWNGDIPWFSVADVPPESDIFVLNTRKSVTQKGIDESSTNILSPGVTIISARGTVGKLALVGHSMAMNQSCYGLSPADGIGSSFLYFVVKKEIIKLRMHAHGSVFDTITRDTFVNIFVIRPPYPIIDAFEKIAWLMLEKIKRNLEKFRALSETRDFLLPKLISGNIRIHNTENLDKVVT